MSEKKYTPGRTAITCYQTDRVTFNRLASLVSVLIGRSATAGETIAESERIVREYVMNEIMRQAAEMHDGTPVGAA